MLSIYNKMNNLYALNQRIGLMQNTLTKDKYNNLITSPSPLYKASCNSLNDIEELTETFVYLTNKNLRESITRAFTEEMTVYVDYLVQNQDDIELQEEIIDLILDFPETKELFNKGLEHE